MKRNVRLYIGGKQADLGDDALILLTYALTDLTNPTAVKNSYTQQITLPGTAANNAIFSNAYKLDRTVGQGYDPTRKVDFVIYEDDDIIQSGYVKLESVTRSKTQVEYHVTLYGGLGSFLYGLTYNESGDKRTLADLDWLGTANPDAEFNFTINRGTVAAAWTALHAGTAGRWAAINFAPCYNGLPDEFDANRALIMQASFDTVFPGMIPDHIGDYTLMDGYTLCTMADERTEWEMCDLRSYLQRPAFSIKAFFAAISRASNNGGYNVVLDPAFFAVPVEEGGNPYYDDAWCTLPMLSDNPQLRETNTSVTPTISALRLSQQGGIQIDIAEVTPDTKATANVNLTLNFASSGSGAMKWKWGTASQMYHRALFAQMLAFDTNGTLCGAGPAVFVTGTDTQFDDPAAVAQKCSIPIFGNGGISDTTVKADIAAGGNVTLPVPVAAQAYGVARYQVYITPIERYIWDFPQDGKVDVYSIPANFKIGSGNTFYTATLGASDAGGSIVAEQSGAVIRSGAAITKAMLMTTERTPADYLLSYCKMFGLVITKDKDAKTIRIRKRSTFYSGSVVDINSRIDRSTQMTIDPSFAESRWLRFAAEVEGGIAESYENQFGRTYGEMRVNTGIDFNSDTQELLDDFAYKGAVDLLDERDAYCVAENVDGDEYPSWMMQDYTLRYYNEDSQDTDFTPQSINDQTWFGSEPRCDVWPKPQFCDNERKPKGGDAVLLMLAGFYGQNGTAKYYLSDDVAKMYDLNDGKPCWMLSYSASDKPAYIPNYSRCLYAVAQVHEQMDFGTPKARYVRTAPGTPEGSDVYSQFWKDYISDRYSRDTVAVTCKVDLSGMNISEDTLRDFYWFDGSIWTLNKINQHSCTTYDLTECEFVKVNDTDNYTE